MKSFYTKLLLLSMLSLCAPRLMAQFVGFPGIKHYPRSEYQAGTQNWQITQADNGMMYFGNNAGLLEFDGSNWQLYKVNDMEQVSRAVQAIGDRVYVAQYNRIGYYSSENNQPLKYTDLFHGDAGGDVWNVFEWRDRIVCQSDYKLMVFLNDSLEYDIALEHKVFSAFVLDEVLYVNQNTVGLSAFRAGKLFEIKNGDLFADKHITCMLPLPNTNIVIGTLNHGLYLRTPEGIKKWEVGADAMLTNYNVYCGAVYNKQYLLFGTIQAGLVVTDLKGKVLMQVDKDRGLSNNTVLSLHVDDVGDVWCGLDNGISLLNFNTDIYFLQDYFDIGTVYVMQEYQGMFYFGTNQGLYYISKEKLQDPLKTKADFKLIEGTRGQVWSLYDAGDALLCGHNRGIFQIRHRQATKVSPKQIEGAWKFLPFPKDSNQLVVGTYAGLGRMQKIAGSWSYVQSYADYKHSASHFVFDKSGSLWINHGISGLQRITFSANYQRISQQAYYNFNDVVEGTSAVMVNDIGGECVFVTPKTFYTWDTASQNFVENKKLASIFADQPHSLNIKEDQQGNLWYYEQGNMGFIRKLEDGRYTNISNPFASVQYMLINGYENIYFTKGLGVLIAVENGFACYKSGSRLHYDRNFCVNIRNFSSTISNEPYIISQRFYQNQKQDSVPVFSYDENNFMVDYAATDFNDEQLSYSSYLEGYDDGFQDWTNRNSREFSNLPQGKYVLRLKAKSRFGVESNELSFAFVVLPPWYKTIAAKLVYLLCFVLLIIGVNYSLNRRISREKQKEQKRQAQLYKEKEHLLKEESLAKEKELIELRNENLQNEVVVKEKELANTTMAMVKKNEFLAEIKAMLEDIKKKEKARGGLLLSINKVIATINKDVDSDNYWELFETHLDLVHEDFMERLVAKHPDLTHRERRLMAFIRMGMSSKEIASLSNISVRSVENNRSRLRQKLNLEQGQNFAEYISQL